MKQKPKTQNLLMPEAEINRKTDVLFAEKKASNSFKSVLKVVIILLFSATIYHSDAARPKNVITTTRVGTGGSIVVIDDYIVEVTTNDGSVIHSIQVYSGTTLVYAAKGCNMTSCEYNLSSLSAGSYEVYAYTSSGNFSGPIEIK